MAFEFTCPHCFKKTLVDDSVAGQEGACVSCGKPIKVHYPSHLRKDSTPTSQSPSSQSTGQATHDSPLASTLPTGPAPSAATQARPGRAIKSKTLALIAKVSVLAVLALVGGGIVLYVMWPSVVSLKATRDRQACKSNLQKIAVALNAYAAEHGTYPTPTVRDADGNPLYSWRVLLLPYLGQENLHAEFQLDEPWDSAQNASLITLMPALFASPSNALGSDTSESNYVLLTGKGTLFPDTGPLGPRSITDGNDRTLLVVEVATIGRYWTEPADIDFTKLTGQPGGPTLQGAPTAIGGSHSGGATVAFADG
ncbi:MAG TPA: hypothetical protein DDW52_09540, partial [Planctomycetaceae bacterium]|nr:hypothetical protein [Planctomycetaceae bacterium]